MPCTVVCCCTNNLIQMLYTVSDPKMKFYGFVQKMTALAVIFLMKKDSYIKKKGTRPSWSLSAAVIRSAEALTSSVAFNMAIPVPAD